MVAAAGILMFAGCKRGEQVAPLNTIYATVASHNGVSPSGGKSEIDGNDVKWSKGDKIALITSGLEKLEKIEYTLSGDGGTTTGTFTGEKPQTETGPYCVVYPFSSVTTDISFSNGGFTVEYSLPQKQNYSKNSFGEGANLSIGYSNDYNFKFLNMMGVLKVTINNDTTCIVEKVELVSRNTADMLWGNGTVTINGSTADNLSFGKLTGGDHILTLGEYMKWEAGDVSLYFVVPAGTLQSGFEIKIYEYGYKNPITKDANEEAIEFTNPNGQNVIQRNMVSVLDFGDRLIPTKGYVDLDGAGKWAQCNYGADKPYEPGGYYQFGGKVDVRGKSDALELKTMCPYIKCPGEKKPKDWGWTKYCPPSSSSDTLLDCDDVVASEIGNGWRIPDYGEIAALRALELIPTVVHGVSGLLLKNKKGNYLFLPASGYWGPESNTSTTASLQNASSFIIGSRMVRGDSGCSAFQALYFELVEEQGVIKVEYSFYTTHFRIYGTQIRPIYDPKQK